MLEAVIFDLDGTLTVLALPLDAMRRDTKAFYINQGLPSDMLEPADGISSTRVKAREYFFERGISNDAWSAMQHSVDSILSKHEASSAIGAMLIDGVLPVVEQIRSMGLKTAILTNNGREAVDLILKELPLQGLFDVIQTRNESPNPKPFPEGLLKVVDRLGVSVSKTLYVGDARIDGVAAGRAGIEFWGVSTGETSEGDLYSVGAALVTDALSEILKHIRIRMSSKA
ncbi:MAG: HAD-IA family hydrolase [Candidatus Thorarchaeota archaeon]|nr:MAG: HAD-IA family hydrolase [Candidatus Thorarchaeota archaeon]